MKNTILLAAVLLVIGGTGVATASEPLLTPRAKDNQVFSIGQAHAARAEAPVLEGGPHRAAIVGSPRYVEQKLSQRHMKGTGQVLASYHRPASRQTLSPKASEQSRVAPLK